MMKKRKRTDHNPEELSPIGRSMLDRRGFLGQSGMSMGAIALSQLLASDPLAGSYGSRTGPIRPLIDENNPYAADHRTSQCRPNRCWSSIARARLATSTRSTTNLTSTNCTDKSRRGFPLSLSKDRRATSPNRFGISNLAANPARWFPTCCRTWRGWSTIFVSCIH